jgi:hypothetical protein
MRSKTRARLLPTRSPFATDKYSIEAIADEVAAVILDEDVADAA